jgi:hypothetical protein
MNYQQFANTVSLQLFQPPFRQKASEKHWPWDQIYTTRTSNRGSEQTFGFTGLPAAQKTPIYGEVYYADMEELGVTKWVHEKYSLGAILPEELIQDQQYIQFTRDLGAAIGEGHAFARDLAAAYPFQNAFTTFTVYDSQPLCGTHTLKNGMTINNAMTGSSITYATVWDAVLYGQLSLMTDKGLPFVAEPVALVYNPINEPEVLLLLKNEFQPHIVERDKNLLPKLTPVPCRFLPNGYWFVTFEGFKEDNFHWSRKEPSVRESIDYDREAVKFTSSSRFSFGPRDFRRIIGNPGV